MRFVSHCVVQRVSIYCCISVCMSSYTALLVGVDSEIEPITVVYWLSVQAPQCVLMYLQQFVVDQAYLEAI